MGTSPVSTRPFWQRINKLRTNKATKSNIPDLKYNGLIYDSDKKEADLFKEILKDTFQSNEDVQFNNNDFYSNVDSYKQ